MDDWTWALIFLGIGVVVGIVVATKYQPQTLASPLTQGTVLTNEDVYEWVDWRGVPRKIVRHRKVKIGEP